MKRNMAGSAFLALLVLASLGSGARARPPQRIVSLNVCSDQLLLALANRRQIAGLTRFAAEPSLSAVAADVRGLPLLTGAAEEVLVIDPDLLLGMPAMGSPASTLFRARHYRNINLEPANSFGDIVRSVRTVAKAVGHPARGEALIGRMTKGLSGLRRFPGKPVAAYYQRRGYMTGSGTLIDDLMTRMGLVNLATRLGKPALSKVGLEEMIAARPDYLIIESATDRVVDNGTEMLHHPALRGIPRIQMPQAWTVCGGPAYVDAARLLSTAVARFQR